MKGILVFLIEGPLIFPIEDNYKIAKIKKNPNIFYKTIGPVSAKLGKNHLL